MVPGDDEEAAKAEGKLLADGRVRHFYDPNRIVGREWFDEKLIREARVFRQSLGPEHPIWSDFEWLEEVKPGQFALWDAAEFYPAGASWKGRRPEPKVRTKQFEYFGEEAEGGITGRFWQSEPVPKLVDSDWFQEIAEGMRAIIDR